MPGELTALRHKARHIGARHIAPKDAGASRNSVNLRRMLATFLFVISAQAS